MHGLKAGSAVTVTALVACATAIAATPSNGRFVGETKGQGKTIKYQQDRSLRFKVSKGAVRSITVGFKAICPPGGEIEYSPGTLPGTFKIKNGRFSGTGRFDDGGSGTISGRFTSSRSASGTLRMKPISGDEGVEGGPEVTCDSGTLKWTARLK